MTENSATDLSRFHAIGINYRKTNAGVRGSFAISNDQYARILELAPKYGISECFILSTCNRTEIYGLAETPGQLVNLLCSQTKGSIEAFKRMAYVKHGKRAIRHLFEVGAGLDSQILGDYEIVGQIKAAVRFAKDRGFAGTFLERAVNGVLQSSKAVKNETTLSGGTISVSFAAVQYILKKVNTVSDKKILLIGTGKIGRNTCKNLVDYLDTKNITLINRTEEKAESLARELDLNFAKYDDLPNRVAASDIILVATNAPKPTILRQHLENAGQKLIIDLSVPCNVEESAAALKNIELVNVDELSKINDETLAKRQAEIPKANAILMRYMDEFFEWLAMRRHAPMLKAIKTKLKEIHTSPLFSEYTSSINIVRSNPDERIQRVVNGTACKIRNHNQGGCYYIEAINEFMAISAG